MAGQVWIVQAAYHRQDVSMEDVQIVHTLVNVNLVGKEFNVILQSASKILVDSFSWTTNF